MKIEILFEDENYIAVNKPAGLMVHGNGKTKEATLVDWILETHPEMKGVGEPLGEIDRPGIVHRLDKETSGALLLAKNQEAYLALKKQFQEHSIEKIYNAFLYGEMKLKEGTIDRPIGRSSNDFRLRTATRGARGVMRSAITDFKTLKVHDGFSYVEARPKTGRTHQIRVHFKALNHPVVCDSLYAPGLPSVLGFSRLALHASQISFELLDGSKKIIKAPFPQDFAMAMKNF